MASAFSHAFVATAFGSAYARHPMPWHFWVLSMTCAILPDADVIGFALGLPYNLTVARKASTEPKSPEKQ